MLLAVVFALAAALANAVNLLTQHKASIGAPQRVKGWRLALYLPRQPLWLLGVAAAVGSFVFQALALHNGPLSVVQPLLITELVFALVLRRVWIHQDVARSAWVSVSVVCVTLAVFLAVGEPTGGHAYPAANQWLSAGLAFGGAIAVLTLLGLRGSPARRAAALAAATGLTASLEASFLKTATQTLSVSGIGGMLADWPVYAFIAATITGALLQQGALHVGPLSVSQPAGHHRPVRQHHLEHLAVQRALHQQPGESRHRSRSVRHDGRRSHHADPDSASGSEPSRADRDGCFRTHAVGRIHPSLGRSARCR